MTELQQRLLNSYGGAELWTSLHCIEAIVSTCGLALRLKQRPFFHHAHISVDIHSMRTRIRPIGSDAGCSTLLDGHTVSLYGPDGNEIERREDAHLGFPYGRRLWKWDDLDMGYFAGYAFWNYFSFPALLMRHDIAWTQVDDITLAAHFSEAIPTHSRSQLFFADPSTWLVRQHNYTVDVISPLATAAHVMVHHKMFGGMQVPCTRRVYPQKKGAKALGFPLLLGIDVHEFQALR